MAEEGITDDPNSWLWIVGVVLVILGSLGQNFGNNLVSYSHNLKNKEQHAQIHRKMSFEEERKKARESGLPETVDEEVSGVSVKSELDRIDRAEKDSIAPDRHGALWFTGTTVFVTGSLLTFAAFGFAAQSLVASLESVQFISNVIFAKYVHGEVITPRMGLATLSIVAGNVLVVLFSTHTAAVLDSTDMIRLYLYNDAFIGYVVGSFVIWGASEVLFKRYHDERIQHNKRFWMHSTVEPMAYVMSSAIIGAVAVLNAKCLSMLIQVSIRGIVDEFVMAPLWIILTVWIGFVAYWLRRLDKGLELFPPMFFIPVIQVAFMFFAIVAGGIYFQEFDVFTWQQWVGFTFGVAMILTGVYGLAPTDVDSLSMGLVLPIDYDPEATTNTTAADGKAVSPASSPVPYDSDDALKQAKLDAMGGADGLDGLLGAKIALHRRDKPAQSQVAASQSQVAAGEAQGEDVHFSSLADAALETPDGGDEAPPPCADEDEGKDGKDSPGKSKRRVVKHGSATPG